MYANARTNDEYRVGFKGFDSSSFVVAFLRFSMSVRVNSNVPLTISGETPKFGKYFRLLLDGSVGLAFFSQ